jgi:hypothetical protein
MWCQATLKWANPDVWETTERHNDAACIIKVHLRSG